MVSKQASPKENYLYNYKAAVKRILDGDTIEVDIDLGFHTRYTTLIRLAGIDTPELGTEAGKEAKRAVEGYLPIGYEVLLDVYKRTDKYGRYLAYVTVNGLNVNANLIGSGLAKEYDGGKRG